MDLNGLCFKTVYVFLCYLSHMLISGTTNNICKCLQKQNPHYLTFLTINAREKIGFSYKYILSNCLLCYAYFF